MYFSIIGIDVENSLAKRKESRPAHIERLKELLNQGRLLVAGPNPIEAVTEGASGFTGSVIIAEFNSLADAQAWADADPYIAAGVYQKVMIKPFIKALP